MAEHANGQIAAGFAMKPNGGAIARISDHTFLAAPITSSSIVLDIGANQGQFTRGMVRDFGCTVHAVEPNPGLCSSLQELAIPGVTVYEAALAGAGGNRAFVVASNSEASRFQDADDSSEGTVQVQALTLEDLVARLPATAGIDLLKMDIEGAELDVLEGAPAELLNRVRQFTIEFHQFIYPESRARIEGIKERFRKLGFWVVDFSRCNYDVLLVNPAVKPGLPVRASVVFEKHRFRVARGLSRLLGS